MWIIPKNLDVSACVRDTLESNWALSELSRICERSLMWRSKPSLARTWLQRLKRVNWMQHLSGRILRPLMADRFETEYTSSLAVIPASHFQSQDKDEEQTTPDTFGRILSESFRQLDLFGASLRTSQDTLQLDTPKFIEAYDLWVTRLRQDCLQRKKLAHLIRENDYLFWRTPETGDSVGRKFSVNSRGEPKLSAQAKIGGLLDQDSPNTNGKSRGLWPTPNNSDQYNPNLPHDIGRNYLRTEVLPDKKTTPQKGKLNPDWVEQLMGLQVGWTDLGCWVTGACHKQ